MKKIITLLTAMAITATVFISCKKDPEPQPSIVGKWNATKQYGVEFKNGVLNGKDTTIFDANHKLIFEFASNPKGKIIEIANLKDTSDFTYQISGNQLTLTTQTGTATGPVSITTNELILTLVEEDVDGNDKYKWEDKIFFTRQ